MEITIRIDQRKKEAKALLEYIKNLPYIEVEPKQTRYNAVTEKTISDAIKGIGLNKAKNSEDLFKKLNL